MLIVFLLLPVMSHCLPRWGSAITNRATTYAMSHRTEDGRSVQSIRFKKPSNLQLYVNKRLIATDSMCNKLPVWRQAKFDQFENKNIQKIISYLHHYCLRNRPYYE